MGLSLFRKSSCRCPQAASQIIERTVIKEPDLQHYTILRAEKVNQCTVLQVMYHHAKNYEGVKILVYQGEPPSFLDPHFCEYHKSPLARFEPTERGIMMAKTLAENLYFAA